MHNNGTNRRQNRPGSNGGGNNTSANEESRMALVLFSIIILYFITNTPRIILNFYEFFTIDTFRENKDNFCYLLPTWVMIMTSISLVLITFNSSINFFIYCVCNTIFQQQFVKHWKLFKSKICPQSQCCSMKSEGTVSQEMSVRVNVKSGSEIAIV